MFRERFTPQVIHTWHGYHQLFASHILVLVEQESIENYANVISIDVVLCGIWPYHNGVLLLHEKFLRSKNLGWKKKTSIAMTRPWKSGPRRNADGLKTLIGILDCVVTHWISLICSCINTIDFWSGVFENWAFVHDLLHVNLMQMLHK